MREVNQSRPRSRPLRALLGDPPIEWENVRTLRDINLWTSERDGYPADLVQKEVRATQRRALLVYGARHLWRKTPPAPRERGGQFPTLVRLLERAGTKVFTVVRPGTGENSPLQPDAPSWPVPCLVVLRNTVLGQARFRFYAPVPPTFPGNDPLEDVLMQDQLDALLLFGPSAGLTTARLSPTLCADQAYKKMRTTRLALMASMIPPGGRNPGEELKQYCASVGTEAK